MTINRRATRTRKWYCFRTDGYYRAKRVWNSSGEWLTSISNSKPPWILT